VGLDFREVVGRTLEIRGDANSASQGAGSTVSSVSSRTNGSSTNTALSDTTFNRSFKNGDLGPADSAAEVPGGGIGKIRGTENGVGRAR